MKPSNTIIVSSEYIRGKEKQIERLQEQLKSANNTMKAMLPFSHNYPKSLVLKSGV